MSHIKSPGTMADCAVEVEIPQQVAPVYGPVADMRASIEQLAVTAPVPHSPREQLLREAIKITTSDRNKAYGNPEDNFNNIAQFWNIYCRNAGITLPHVSGFTGIDVAHMMVLMKMARLSTNPLHRDSILDVAGYAACAADFCKS